MAKILVVDDKDSNRATLKYFLGGMHNYEIIEAKDGFEAFNAYRNSPADLIITDMQMPGMSGLQLINKIREINKNQHVLLMSGNKVPKGWDGPFIEKPFALTKLLLIVDNVLSSRPE